MQRSSRETAQERETTQAAALRIVPFALVILLAASYLIAIPLGLIGHAQRLATPEIVLAAALLAVLAFVAQNGYAITDLPAPAG